MNATVMRTHEHVKEFADPGFTEKQAEAIVRQQAGIVSDHAATKQGIDLLEKKLIIKLGAMIIGGVIFTIGIVLTILPLMLE